MLSPFGKSERKNFLVDLNWVCGGWGDAGMMYHAPTRVKVFMLPFLGKVSGKNFFSCLKLGLQGMEGCGHDVSCTYEGKGFYAPLFLGEVSGKNFFS
ncbi:hypothetical protein MASR2M15_18320 [Anaerolineales bacterium]